LVIVPLYVFRVLEGIDGLLEQQVVSLCALVVLEHILLFGFDLVELDAHLLISLPSLFQRFHQLHGLVTNPLNGALKKFDPLILLHSEVVISITSFHTEEFNLNLEHVILVGH
jgi:hypothetical protein